MVQPGEISKGRFFLSWGVLQWTVCRLDVWLDWADKPWLIEACACPWVWWHGYMVKRVVIWWVFFFSENTSLYSLKAVSRVTFSLVTPWAMIVDIDVHLMMNSGTQLLVLKSLACCSGIQVLKVLYSSSSIWAPLSCSIYHRRYRCSNTSGGSPVVHL